MCFLLTTPLTVAVPCFLSPLLRAQPGVAHQCGLGACRSTDAQASQSCIVVRPPPCESRQGPWPPSTPGKRGPPWSGAADPLWPFSRSTSRGPVFPSV